jgi:IS5 family transposase
MDRIVPWANLCAVIEPHYPKPGNGRPPIGLENILRIHFTQHWFNLARIDLGCEAVPVATTLLKFHRLLEKHNLNEQLFAEVGRLLQDGEMTLKT